MRDALNLHPQFLSALFALVQDFSGIYLKAQQWEFDWLEKLQARKLAEEAAKAAQAAKIEAEKLAREKEKERVELERQASF